MEDEWKMGTADTNFCYHCDEMLQGKCSGIGNRNAFCNGQREIFCKSWEQTCAPFRKLKEARECQQDET